ncbi:MAG: amidohydrolase family protein [Bacillota bacterium]
MKTLLSAAWIAPIDRPLIREGAVVFDARQIVAVGSAEELIRQHPDAAVEHLGSVVLLPGLINAHTHLELSQDRHAIACPTGGGVGKEPSPQPSPGVPGEGEEDEDAKARRGEGEERRGRSGSSHCSEPGVEGGKQLPGGDSQDGAHPASFVQWIQSLMSQRRVPPDQMPPLIDRALSIGVAQCLRFGVTAVGDISRECHLTRPLLRKSALRVVSYGEIQAMAQRRGFLEERLATARDSTYASERLRVGLSPHAPYSVEGPGYRRCLEVAKAQDLPLATHLAETSDEAAFLANHTGPFRDLWSFLDGWDDRVPRFDGGPIRFAQQLGLLDYPTLLAHVNYCDDAELEILARGQASVVYCPRTHAYFGHPPHRWRDMLARGINVAVGTDSCASSPDLNLVDDLRLVHEVAPEVLPQTLWEMATLRAARAIGQGLNLGSLTCGKCPDLIGFRVCSADPLREILETPHMLPAQIWIGGQRLNRPSAL